MFYTIFSVHIAFYQLFSNKNWDSLLHHMTLGVYNILKVRKIMHCQIISHKGEPRECSCFLIRVIQLNIATTFIIYLQSTSETENNKG